MFRFFLSFFVSSMLLTTSGFTMEQNLTKDSIHIEDFSKRVAAFYAMDENEQVKEITDKVLASPYTLQSAKDSIKAYQRRIFVFKYPSDGLKIYGFISFTPNPERHPLELLFRGGNREFGLLNPGDPLATYQNETVLSSTLRGGISEGKDEFGVADLADVKNMVDYLPTLEKKLHIHLNPEYTYALGESRGALEMFLTLAKYPELQDRLDKIVSLSGLIDINSIIREREDMKEMFKKDFGYRPGENDQQWIKERSSILAVPYLKKTLPVLVIHGTKDIRVSCSGCYELIEKLKENGNPVTFWEIEGGTHSLINQPDMMDYISKWVQSQKGQVGGEIVPPRGFNAH
jgi:dipeptidyl aminopeptidase/acylaminoacyl peptidase